MKKRIVQILGTNYEVIKKKYNKDNNFKEMAADGFCDSVQKKIVYCDMKTCPGWEEEPVEKRRAIQKQILRHEIIHAFLSESGLDASSGTFKTGWALNEEMVDWIASQFPKILKVYEGLGIVE